MTNIENEKKGSIALNSGVLLGIISVLSVVIQYAFGTYDISGGESGSGRLLSIASFVLGLVIVVLAIIRFKQSQGGFASFMQCFKVGFTIYIVSSLFVAAWMLTYCYVLEPEYQDGIIDQTVQQMDAQGGMTEEQMETGISWTRKFTSPFMLAIFSIMGAAFFGGIVSAITAAILKKDKPVFEYQSEDADNN